MIDTKLEHFSQKVSSVIEVAEGTAQKAEAEFKNLVHHKTTNEEKLRQGLDYMNKHIIEINNLM